MGKNSDVLSVGNKIWKSSDGESWMFTTDQLLSLILNGYHFNTIFVMQSSKKKKTKGLNRFYEALMRNIDEDRANQKLGKRSKIFCLKNTVRIRLLVPSGL